MWERLFSLTEQPLRSLPSFLYTSSTPLEVFCKYSFFNFPNLVLNIKPIISFNFLYDMCTYYLTQLPTFKLKYKIFVMIFIMERIIRGITTQSKMGSHLFFLKLKIVLSLINTLKMFMNTIYWIIRCILARIFLQN